MSQTMDASTSALLLLDLQTGFLERLPAETTESILNNTEKVIAAARKHGTKIHYIHAALTNEEISAIPDHSPSFSAVKANPQVAANMVPESPKTQIHARLAPQGGDAGEKLYRKIRYGAFMRGPSLALLEEFRAAGVQTIAVAGVITSGAVLSAVRQLADLDYRLLVIRDCCGEHDPAVHDFVVDKVLSKQAQIVDAEEMVRMLS